MDAAFLDQLQQWNEEDNFQAIIDAMEALPQEELTPNLVSDLARAYNNLARPEDRHLFHRAIKLLRSVEDEFPGDHCWNFRMAYAYYYLDQEGPALHYFEKALEGRPGDQDTLEFIEDCRRRLALPMGLKPFRQRVLEGWASFWQGEEELRRLLDRKDREVISEEVIAKCSQLLSPVFEDAAFELGRNGEKYELILTPEGDRARLFKLVYFQRRAPKALLEQWKVQVGRSRSSGFGLRMYGQDVSAADAQVWVEKLENQLVGLSIYCEKLLPLLRENENQAYNLMTILLDQAIGELPAIRYVDYMDLLDAPKEGDSIAPDQLAGYIEGEIDPEGWASASDPETACQRYTAYQIQPSQEEDQYLREDVFVGVTTCPPLINTYYRGEDSLMDNFHQDGAVPGFLYYPQDGIDKKDVLDLRDALENAILEQAGEDCVTFTGGATGVQYGYLDFIAWDLKATLDAAALALTKLPMKEAAFHTFRRDVPGICLKREEEAE